MNWEAIGRFQIDKSDITYILILKRLLSFLCESREEAEVEMRLIEGYCHNPSE